MKFIHKDATRDGSFMSVSLEYWHKDYLPNKKYLNYVILEHSDIFDLFEIDEETGNSDIYIKSGFEGELKKYLNEKPFKYVMKPVAKGRLDDYLMPVDDFALSRSDNQNIKEQAPKPKKNALNKSPYVKDANDSKLWLSFTKVADVITNNKLIVTIISIVLVSLTQTNRFKSWLNELVNLF